MKTLYLSIITATLLIFMQSMAYALDAPPVDQALVREGDYAVEMVKALNIKAAHSEADAETALATLGIAPESGWISDFPVTPDIIVQLQTSVDEAISAGRLSISREAAYNALLALNERLGLSITVAGDADNAGQPEVDQDIVDTYYTDEGPPVITYYAPPLDYAYLYAWDPYPFWCDGYFFPGFFILTDFDVDISHHHRHHHDGDDDRDGHWGDHHRVTNHVVGPDSGRAAVLDPISRHPLSKTDFRPIGASSFEPVARPGSVVTRRGDGTATRSFNKPEGGTFNRDSASRLVGRGTISSGRSADVTDSRIVNTRSAGRELPASMCSIGNCSPRSSGSRGYSGEVRTSGSVSVERGGSGVGWSRGYGESRPSAPAAADRGGFSGGESRGFSGGGRSVGSSGGFSGGESRGGGGFSGGESRGTGGGWSGRR